MEHRPDIVSRHSLAAKSPDEHENQPFIGSLSQDKRVRNNLSRSQYHPEPVENSVNLSPLLTIVCGLSFLLEKICTTRIHDLCADDLRVLVFLRHSPPVGALTISPQLPDIITHYDGDMLYRKST